MLTIFSLNLQQFSKIINTFSDGGGGTLTNVSYAFWQESTSLILEFFYKFSGGGTDIHPGPRVWLRHCRLLFGGGYSSDC